jgi:hypothetical protein
MTEQHVILLQNYLREHPEKRGAVVVVTEREVIPVASVERGRQLRRKLHAEREGGETLLTRLGMPTAVSFGPHTGVFRGKRIGAGAG